MLVKLSPVYYNLLGRNDVFRQELEVKGGSGTRENEVTSGLDFDDGMIIIIVLGKDPVTGFVDNEWSILWQFRAVEVKETSFNLCYGFFN